MGQSIVNAGETSPRMLFSGDLGAIDPALPWPSAVIGNLINCVPIRTFGWTEIFGYFASDRAMVIRLFWGVMYNDNTDRLVAIDSSDVQQSYIDAQIGGVNVVKFNFPVIAPFVILQLTNTAMLSTTYLHHYVALRI